VADTKAIVTGSGWHRQGYRHELARALLLGGALVAFLFPLGWTALASLGVRPRGTAPPSLIWPPSLEHFGEVGIAEPHFWQELATSTLVSVAGTLLTIVVSLLAAYGLARSRFRGKAITTQGFLVLASLPVMAYAIPLGEVMRRLGLSDTYLGLILGVSAVTAPLAVYVLYGHLSGLSTEWEEAAWLDGAGLGRVLWNVVVPMIGPALAATAIVVFVLDWNLLLVPLVVAGAEIKTIPVALIDFFTFERELEWPTAAAALIISLVPLTVLVAVGHRLLDRFSLGPTRQ
jgi:ABC-type glycerol-3-phosphate transport system permease component